MFQMSWDLFPNLLILAWWKVGKTVHTINTTHSSSTLKIRAKSASLTSTKSNLFSKGPSINNVIQIRAFSGPPPLLITFSQYLAILPPPLVSINWYVLNGKYTYCSHLSCFDLPPPIIISQHSATPPINEWRHLWTVLIRLTWLTEVNRVEK